MTAPKTLSITVCTDDPTTLLTVGEMFIKLSGIQPEAFIKFTAPSAEFNESAAVQQCGRAIRPPADKPVVLGPVSAPLPPAIEPGDSTVDPAAAFSAGNDDDAGWPEPGGSTVTDSTPTLPLPPQLQPPAPPLPPAAPTPPAATSTVELDKSGLPWDSRINTSNKAKTAKLIWKRAPGLTDEQYNGVLAELRGIMTLPPAATAAPVPAPPVPAAATVIPPAAEPADTPTTYAQLLGAIARHIPAKITAEEVTNVCAMKGLPSLNSVSTRPDLIPGIYADCKAIMDTRA